MTRNLISVGAPTLRWLAAISMAFACSVHAQIAGDGLDSLVEAREIPVTIDNFARVASDVGLDKYVTLAEGVNRF